MRTASAAFRSRWPATTSSTTPWRARRPLMPAATIVIDNLERVATRRYRAHRIAAFWAIQTASETAEYRGDRHGTGRHCFGDGRPAPSAAWSWTGTIVATGYLFGELRQNTLSGAIFAVVDNNGAKAAGEPGFRTSQVR